jgi:hypothetical protein
MFFQRPVQTRLSSQPIAPPSLQYDPNTFQRNTIPSRPASLASVSTRYAPSDVGSYVSSQASRSQVEEDDRSSVYSVPSSAHQLQIQQQQQRMMEEQMSQYSQHNTQELDETRQLKAIVKEWFEIDNTIREVNGKLNMLRKKRKTLQEDILRFMEDYEIDELKTPQDTIELASTIRNQYVNSRSLLTMLTQFATEKNIPALKHFLVSTPLHTQKTASRLKRTKNFDSVDLESLP